MVDRRSLSKYISNIEGYLEKLDVLQKEKKAKVMEDWRIQGEVERYLQVTIECLLNIGEMLINGYKFRKPETYADIIKVLTENKVISKKLQKQLEDIAKFRNILVHDYLYLDYNKVYKHLQKDPQIIKKFIEAIKKFIASQGQK